MGESQVNSNQYVMFLQQFIKNPKRVGSVVPSSRFLASKMVQSVPWEEVSAMAELGSGTGAITRLIQQRVEESTKVLLFEMDDKMKHDLQTNYPDFICHSNACHLTKTMNQKGIPQLDCVISGLPFFNFENDLRETLLNNIIEALKPGGYFIAFQYSLQMMKHLSKNFNIEKIDFVPLNFPPAFVYTCRKKEGI
ncbi:class I SAM-dependent methyltransferase [Paenibacillus sp. MAH-36]|uniref:Methyltransferase domain-containing protein n=1 Tax=Paenibacillus violae TaxID=3077234 RepID=A0ABU3RKN7_9BACL|nr:methyltransferase domain-containing protein [Paenibacillus sp. PFR10]MDU0204850.1 methyltransferase domain-containing protein [Paenibacillus sp. PFR10]